MDPLPVSLHRLGKPALPNNIPLDSRASVLAPALVILVGLLLRLAMLGVDVRFHPDEALFAAQARLVSHQGDVLLRETDLDKPPLTFYVTALSFRLLTPSEFAARWPNVLFSGLSVAVLVALAQTLCANRSAALLATWLWAVSPYDLAFSATVFTDIQATFWTLVAAWCAARDRWRWSGTAAALMFASKSNAVLFVPLIIALGLARNARGDWQWLDGLRRLWCFAWPFLVGIGLLVAWDQARVPRSFLSLGYTRNNPGRLIRSGEVWPRLEQWWHWLGFVTGVPALNALLIAGGVAVLGWAALHRRTRGAAVDWLIAGFAAAFLGWHWLVAFPVYDRYLHTLVPFLLLLAARLVMALTAVLGPGRRRLQALVIVALIGIMVPGTYRVLHGNAAIGGDQGQHTGIVSLAHFLNTTLNGEIVYDHWLNWELAYYLGELPGVRVLYAPLPEALAAEMADQCEPRYFAAPSIHHAAPWIAVLGRSGVVTQTVYLDQENGFVVYRLAPSCCGDKGCHVD
jgi:4-amino-4-deoxy-L-arabinose transferase-like glycosyltransferase